MKLSIIPAKAWFIGAAVVTAAVGALEANGRFAAAQEAAERSAAAGAAALDGAVAVSPDTLKDVEIMRRVLVREGLGARVSDARIAFYGVSQSGAYTGTAGPADASLVPGHGVLFVLRTADPVAPPPAAATPAPSKSASAWEEEAAAFEGRSRETGMPKFDVTSAEGAALRGWLVGGSEYDGRKVEALRTRIVEQLALFGSRIRGLAPTDRVSVVVSGGAVVKPAATSAAVTPAPDSAPVAAGAAEVDAAGRLLSRTHAASVAAQLVRVTAGGIGPATTMTISVSVADCDAAAKGTMTPEEFRRRAVVSQY